MELTPLSWLLAFLPILTVMVLMLAFKWGGMRSSAASWIVTVIVSLAFFGGTWKILAWSQVKSIFLSFNLLYIIWGALLLYSLANEVGAIRMISDAIPHLSSDRSLQVLTIAFLLTSFLQGMGGFGVPVAVCAPILVSLGFSPILAVVLTAIGHSWAVAFGSMASAYESLISVTAVPGIQIAPYAAAFFALSYVPIAGIITVLSTGWKSLWKTMPAILAISAAMSLTLWVLVTNGLWSLGSIGPALMGLLTMFLITRLPAYRGKADPAGTTENKQSFLLTIMPYILLVSIGFLIILIKPLNQFLSRVQFSFSYPEVVSKHGLVTPAQVSDPISFFSHPGSVLMYSILISSLIFHIKGYFKTGAWRRILSRLAHSAISASLGVITMVGVSTIMTHTGMTSLIARGISEAINRSFYPTVSPFLGALGAFLTGSNSNSNILFGVIQKESAQLLGLSVPLILAGQNAGASFASVMSPAKLIISFTYQPEENWHGTDTFTYTASDGDLESAAATVTITVPPVNDAPVAVDDAYTTDEDTVLTVAAPGVLANDYDVDGDNLTVTLKTDVSHGTLILNGDGSFVYTPDENWYGTDSFVYNLISYPSITAEGWTDEATVTITVKPVYDAPVAVDDAYSTAYETALTIATPGVLANDTDVEGSALTATLVAGPANGTVTLNADGSFTYTPAAGFSGTDSFTYTANDGELDSNIATVSIVVAASTNNPPVAVNDTYTTAFGTTLTVPVPGVLGNDTDADNDPLTAIKVSGPVHGTLTFNADGSFTYVPDANFSGIDTFTYKANDGESDSNVATVSILVEAFVNTPPVAQDQSVTTPEDTAIAITLTATDANNDTLTYWIVGQPQHGTLTLAGNVATYTPDQDYNGSDSFTFKANDGTTDSNIATVSITVTPVNDDPVAQDLQVTTPEDTPIDITLIGTDVDGDTLTYEIVDEPLNGTVTLVGNVATYTPDEDYNGTDSFTYKVNDGELESNLATVTITVTPVNDAPVAVDDAYTTVEDTLLAVDAPGVLDNDYDVDGDDMTVTLRTNVSHGTLILLSDGSFTYQPDQDFFGTDSFTYTLLTHPHITSGWTDWATVTITVTPVNDAPVLDEIADATIPEMVEYTFTATATDVDSTDLTFSLIDAPEGAAINAATGVFTWTPTEAQGPAEYTFTVKVCDDGEPVLCDEQSVTLTVQEVNLAPELDPIADQEVVVGDELTFTATATDPDLPAQTLLFYLSGAPAGASIDASTGVFTWTPIASQIGEHSFEVCVTDGDLADCQEITVTVLQGFVNTAPVAVADAYEVEYEGVLEVQAPGVLENDSDVDGDPLIALLVSTTSNGTLTFNQDGSFTYVPRAWFSGTDTFTYKANDGELDSNIVTVTITVHPLPVSYFYFPLIFK